MSRLHIMAVKNVYYNKFTCKGVKLQILMYTYTIIILQNRRNHFPLNMSFGSFSIVVPIALQADMYVA
jgi:hypothetical protein